MIMNKITDQGLISDPQEHNEEFRHNSSLSNIFLLNKAAKIYV